MGISFYRRCFLALVLMGWGQFVFAEDYYWRWSQFVGGVRPDFSSPQAACYAWRDTRPANVRGNQLTVTVDTVSWVGRCSLQYDSAMNIVRGGTACPNGTVLNTQTGECEAPEEPEPDRCEEMQGQETTASTVYPDVKYEFCITQCVAAVTSVKASSTPNAFGPTYIYYNATFTGESCAQDTPNADAGGDTPAPTEAEENQDCGPTTVTYDEEGRRHEVSNCTTTQTTRDNQACVSSGGSVGEVDGVLQCVAKQKGPTTSETKTDVKKETETAEDGSKKEVTTTTTSTTTCKGGQCTTTTTTTTSTDKTNADGTSGGSSSICKGDNCSGSGSGGGGGSSGSGNGDSEGEGEEEGEGPAGPDGTLTQGEGGDFSEGIAEWDQRIADIRGELDQKLDEYSGLFKGVFDLDLSTGGGSLLCENIPVSFGVASTTLRFCLADYADQLSYLRYALLLGAAALAAVIILRG